MRRLLLLSMTAWLLWTPLHARSPAPAPTADIPEETDPFRLDRSRLMHVKARYGEAAVQRLQQWRALVHMLRHADIDTQLKAVNDFFNQRYFADDQIIWGQRDYWASPIEFLSRNAGDCEDFAIAKYFTLRALGVPDDKLYLTYVRAIRLNQAHMVVTYFREPHTAPLVLDNIDPHIRPADRRPDLAPVYSLNGAGIWRARKRGRGPRLGPSHRLDKWNTLLARIQRTGL